MEVPVQPDQLVGIGCWAVRDVSHRALEGSTSALVRLISAGAGNKCRHPGQFLQRNTHYIA